MTSADKLRSLEKESYINVETFKRDGTGVKTPVWFAHGDGELVFFTDGRSWKVKRLRNDDRVRVAACDVRGKVHGPWHDGHGARLEGEEARRAHALLTKKYFLMRVGNVAARVVGRTKHRAYYRITLD